jgi:hypothetical protein
MFAYFFFSALYLQLVLGYSPLEVGLALMTVALVLLARTPVDGNWLIDILPATLAVGVGAGIAFNPILLAAMSGVAQEQAGLASGVVNTAFMMGGAVGLAILASLADFRTESLLGSGGGTLVALNRGYHAAFIAGTVFIVASAAVGWALLRVHSPTAHESEHAVGAPAAAEAD